MNASMIVNPRTLEVRTHVGDQSKELSFYLEIYQNVFRIEDSKDQQITDVQPFYVYLPVLSTDFTLASHQNLA